MWRKDTTNDRPSNDSLIDTLFEDMKKMDSVIKRLQREINDVRNASENTPNDMKMMDSILKDLTREVHELKMKSHGHE
jgi:peptidoglycan hydrolase CwlO-like protein